MNSSEQKDFEHFTPTAGDVDSTIDMLRRHLEEKNTHNTSSLQDTAEYPEPTTENDGFLTTDFISECPYGQGAYKGTTGHSSDNATLAFKSTGTTEAEMASLRLRRHSPRMEGVAH